MINHWKKKLIDFSRKNSLLYFKFEGKSHIELLDFSEEMLLDFIEGKAIKFDSKSQTSSSLKTHWDKNLNHNFHSRSLLLSKNKLTQVIEVANASLGEEIQKPLLESNLGGGEETIQQSAAEEEQSEDNSSDTLEELTEEQENLTTENDPYFLRNKHIERLRSRDRLAKQDLGVNILYLAYGFIQWKENEYGNRQNYSPLFLIPVSIERSSGLSPKYSLLISEEEEIVFNPALRMFFKQNLQLDLSFIPEKFDDEKISLDLFDYYFFQLQDCLKEACYQDWQINKEKCISVFNFQKLSLFKEMESFGHRMIRHPIIAKLSQREPFLQPEWTSIKELDRTQSAEEDFCVLDADSSQQEAINAAKQGISFVLDGPPGTGKSQTITNIIAELLAQGKKILFVSEKKAALNVVRDRLESCNLGNFCLVMHDTRKKDKSGFVKRLNECYETLDSEYEFSEDFQNKINKIDRLKAEINESAEVLHRPFGEWKIRPYDAYSRAASKKYLPEINFEIENIFQYDDLKWDKVNRLIERLSQQIGSGESSSDSSSADLLWSVVRTKEHHSLTQRENLKKSFAIFANTLEKLRSKSNVLFSSIGMPSPKSLRAYKEALPFITHLVSPPPLAHQLWNEDTLSNFFRKLNESQILNRDYATLRDYVLGYAMEGCSESYIHKILLRIKAFKQMPESEFLGTADYQDLMKDLEENFYLVSYQIGSLSAIEEDLVKYNNFLRQRTYFDDFKSSLDLSSGFATSKDLIQAANGDEAILQAEMEKAEKWLLEFTNYNYSFSNKFQELLCSVLKSNKTLAEAHAECSKSLETLEEEINKLQTTCDLPDLENIEWIKLIKLTSLLGKDQKAFQDWLDLCALSKEFTEEDLSGFFENALTKPKLAKSLKEIFQKRFYSLWIDNVERQESKLMNFKGEDFASLVTNFCKLDKELFQNINQKRVFKKIQENFVTKKIPQTQLKSLCTLSNQKRPRKSVRRIIKELRKLVLEVHPCWMMSPLSVSQLIELEPTDNPSIFDTVIFDEASQIFPEDAICSIFRGKQLIVAGDPEQMPPTNFGKLSGTASEDLNDDEEDENPEFESILNLALTSLKQKKALRLLWHYRSKFEELIHPSNQKIYNQELITFPASREPKNKAVSSVFVEDGIFDRGKSKTNRAEARRLAEHLFEILQAQKDSKQARKSIGIISLGASQADCIEEEIEKLRLKNPELEEFFVENINPENRIFVKNLETVQGDERDIILLSVAYGKDASGKLYQNFGPINQKEVGQRRLNVAVTRAKERMIVFCSFMHHELKVTEEHSKGLNFLRDYLCFAQTGILSGSQNKRQRPVGSALIDEIALALNRKGYKTKQAIGHSEYKLDLAVVQANEEETENQRSFVLGIECDGEMYNSAKTCRDRDRLRAEVMQKYGWNLHRVWSRDWYQDPDKELEKITVKLENLLSALAKTEKNEALV